MFKRIFTITSLLLLSMSLLVAPTVALGQSSITETTNKELANEIYFVKVNLPSVVTVNQPAVFSVSPQFDTDKVTSVEYLWDFGDGNRDIGKEVVHTYAEPGNFRITVETKVVTSTGEERTVEEAAQIFVSQRFAILISDRKEISDKINKFIKLAKEDNITLQLFESYDSQSAFLAEEVLSRKLIELSDNVEKSNTILVWTESGTGLNALSRYLQAKESANLQNTTIVLFTDEITNLQRIERQYQQIRPREIIVVREPGIGINFLESPDTKTYKQALAKGGYEFHIVNDRTSEIKPWRLLSYSLNFMTEKGIPDNILILILLLPIIATVIAFLKQVVGVTTLGLYTPAIITLTFLILGLKFGVIILFFITLVSILIHKVLKQFRLLYIPKMAIVITIVSLTIFILFSLAVLLNLVDVEFISLAIFPTVVMGTLVEKVVTANSSKTLKKTAITIIEVLFVSIIAYVVAGGPIDLSIFQFQFEFVKNFISNYPEAIIIVVVINTLLGRWTGLRLTEYIHFHEILYNTEE